MDDPLPPPRTARLSEIRAARAAPDEIDLSPGPTPCLVMVEPAGPGLGARFPLGGEVTVGRGTGCGMMVPDMSVSRTHARLAPLPGGRFRVTDLGSANGTFVNDEPVSDAEIGDGDRLRLGACVFRFVAARA